MSWLTFFALAQPTTSRASGLSKQNTLSTYAQNWEMKNRTSAADHAGEWEPWQLSEMVPPGHHRSCCWTTHVCSSHRGFLRVHCADNPEWQQPCSQRILCSFRSLRILRWVKNVLKFPLCKLHFLLPALKKRPLPALCAVYPCTSKKPHRGFVLDEIHTAVTAAGIYSGWGEKCFSKILI